MSKPKPKGNTPDLFYELVRTDFIMRYHNSILGFIWVLLKPFLLFLIIVVVFSWLFKSQDPFYPLNLLLGVLLYSYFSESTLRGVTSLYEKSTIIQKVNFPKVITAYTSVVNSFISFFAGFLVFLIFWFFNKPQASLAGLPYFFLLVLILSGLILAINLFTSIIYIKLKDLFSIWEVFLQLIFWGTPIVYPLSIIPEKLKNIVLLNPLAIVITESQSALISGQAYLWPKTIFALVIAILLLALGFWFFNKNINQVTENV